MYVHCSITKGNTAMYRKNGVPMYEGDGFIHSSPKQDDFQNSSPPVATLNPGSPAELRPGLAGAARELLHKLAVWIGVGVRHPQGKALEN